ncbi:MAG: hypothetical protein NTU99_16950 [Pseudanabaena sp. LacPavin_0818_WC45_MAG_42_6]|nr:hypothetical protein [Pseudanabaena sp. LacPavin_0818_WC45_MAG_42_6]
MRCSAPPPTCWFLIIAIAINAANILSHDAIAENANVLREIYNSSSLVFNG